jgi:transcriptional regulator with XRE-family HTH domain
MTDYRILIGKRFRAIRKSLNLTQDEMAACTTLSQAHISYIENGRFCHNLQRVAEAVAAAGGNPEELFEETSALPPLVAQIRDLALVATPEEQDMVRTILERIIALRRSAAAGN